METADRAWADIDLEALKNNFRIARKLAAGARMAAVIKADAYGHGLLQAAETLRDEADLFGVTDLEEARRLAAAEPGKPILILQGFIQPAEIKALAEGGFQLVVHSLEQLAMLEEKLARLNLKAPLTIWLKMDSGMGRLGILPKDYPGAWRKLAGKPYTGRLIMMTHLANASLPDSGLNLRQLHCFDEMRERLKGVKETSIASSAGLMGDFGFPGGVAAVPSGRPPYARPLERFDVRSDWARPGLMLYGSSPFPYELGQYRAEATGLEPVMTFRSRLIAVKDLKAGDNVGYCSQFICPEDMRVGIVCAGYADGYPSNAPNGTPVLVSGRRAHTVGRVSMDMLAVDLSQLPEARPGDPVTLWGRGLSIDEVADVTGIISYNLLCSVTTRVKFHYG